MSEPADHAFMARALRLARRRDARTHPNPSVGCVVVDRGDLVGEGVTQRPGGPHAEIAALDAAGSRAAGATVYVTLEPCAHTGRTGPCAAALIAARVARVVYSVDDPNPLVAGQGAAMLRDAGIAVETPLLADAARAVNRGYFSRIERGRPWVRLKLAASLDGRTALANGQSQWITGPAARRDVHRFRARSSAIMTGVGTVLADDPSLTARPPDDPGLDLVQPVRVVVDSALRTPASARIFDGQGGTLIFAGEAAANARRKLEDVGGRIETVAAGPRCDLGAVVARLGALEVNDLWVEAGSTLSGALLAARLVDELVLYLAPCLLGPDARGLAALPALSRLDERWRLVIDDTRRVGDDLRIMARPVPVE